MNEGISEEGNKIYYVYESFFKLRCDFLLITIINIEDIKKNIDKCSGIIM